MIQKASSPRFPGRGVAWSLPPLAEAPGLNSNAAITHPALPKCCHFRCDSSGLNDSRPPSRAHRVAHPGCLQRIPRQRTPLALTEVTSSWRATGSLGVGVLAGLLGCRETSLPVCTQEGTWKKQPGLTGDRAPWSHAGLPHSTFSGRSSLGPHLKCNLTPGFRSPLPQMLSPCPCPPLSPSS